jgi:hypothetical protein
MMKYYYLTADGTTAGPETLEMLCGMVAGGGLDLSVMVVPAGGEDWTPLARVLRFFYANAAGETVGPVAFSELNRLHQTGVLAPPAWVMEEHGAEWKQLAEVLAAAGVPVTAPSHSHPLAPAPVFRPPAGTRTAPVGGVRGTHAGHKSVRIAVVRHHPRGGMDRAPFIACTLVLLAFAAVVLAVIGFPFRTWIDMDGAARLEFWHRHWTALISTGSIMALGLLIAGFLRVRNIGWPWPAIVVLLVPVPLLAWPPGYARHRRFDTASKVIAGVSVALLLALLVLSMLYWKPAKT